MFDTNIYEFLNQKDLSVVESLVNNRSILLYGCRVIRVELRKIPREVKVDGKSYRNKLLSLYDKLVGKRSYSAEGIAESLAEEYWIEYTGGSPKRKILPDFKIVATASIHGLDTIVSEDDRTLKSQLARIAYLKVNSRNGFSTPTLISLEELKLL